ncbi:MAG TPA: hypothetical protein VH413_02745 [Verrucomicrobiae bacterium]|jgi:hypothetical protein|nr:hypothetical protein [Verrucomicrobiae bacterium]
MINLIWPVVSLAFLTLVAGWAWWSATRRPRQWGLLVDRENDFWQKRGVLSPALVEKIKSWEKGRPLKWIAGAATCLGTFGVIWTTFMLCKAMALEHRRIPMPMNPALHIKAVSKSGATNKPAGKP